MGSQFLPVAGPFYTSASCSPAGSPPTAISASSAGVSARTNPPRLKAPGKPRQEFIAYTYFIAGLRCYDIGDLYKPKEVAYFVPAQGGDLKKFGTYDRTVDNVFIEWNRNVIWTATDTGLYALSCPNLSKPVVSHVRGRMVA